MRVLLLLSSIILIAQPLYSQGTKERIMIHSNALEGNLVGDPADREVTVYMPPSYQSDTEKRYPVLYMLHGYTDTDSQWFGWEEHWINLFNVIETSLQEGLSKEMIVVMPNAYNRFKGSMYSSSVTIGDWETFVTKELVDFIDKNYRTLAQAESRGLAGHSMGGYGSIRLGMKYSEVYSSIYLLSPCCMEGGVPSDVELMNRIEEIESIDQLDTASFFTMVAIASSAAWAPNPQNPPLYLDLPFSNGEVIDEIANKIIANRILNSIEQYIPNMKRLNGIAMDAGDKDRRISQSTMRLHELLNSYDIPHYYESYDGDHLSGIADRIRTKVLPFFSQKLVFE